MIEGVLAVVICAVFYFLGHHHGKMDANSTESSTEGE